MIKIGAVTDKNWCRRGSPGRSTEHNSLL